MMCIVCNTAGNNTGLDFLDAYADARAAMERATKAMLACSKGATTPEIGKNYDSIHKQMVALQGKWNQLEHLREHIG